MRRVVIESPYAGNIVENMKYARRCALDCLERGEAPYASHLFFTQPGLLNDDDPNQRKLGIEAGLVWGRSADLVAVYVDRGVSHGMVQGIREARRRGTPIELRSLERSPVVCPTCRGEGREVLFAGGGEYDEVPCETCGGAR